METNSSGPPMASTTTQAAPLIMVGLGGAGGAILDSVAASGLPGVRCLALDTDAQALERRHGAVERRVFGLEVARGWSCGGDPDHGAASAQADLHWFKEQISGARLVWLVAGLGGGFGGGAAPLLARAAREAGAFSVALGTLPPGFEGERRRRQAHAALRALESEADLAVKLPIEGVCALLGPRPLFHDIQRQTAESAAAAALSLARSLNHPAGAPVSLAEVRRAVGPHRAAGTIAAASAHGSDRAALLVERVAGHPFFEGGARLAEADAILASVLGGPDLTRDELAGITELFAARFPRAELVVGAAADPVFTGRIDILVWAIRRTPAGAPQPDPAATEGTNSETEAEAAGPPPRNRPDAFAPPPPALSTEQKQRLAGKQGQASGRTKAVQTLFNFDVVSVNRFAQTEPTIRRGENLDEPTWARRGLSMN